MTTKLFAGIDISSTDAALYCLDHEGNKFGPVRTVDNNLEGAYEILSTVTTLDADETHIGLEATSVYGAHLRDFLLNNGNSHRGWFVYEYPCTFNHRISPQNARVRNDT